MGTEQDVKTLERLSHEIFPLKRTHIIKLSTCLLHCSFICPGQNQTERWSAFYVEEQELGTNVKKSRVFSFLNDRL